MEDARQDLVERRISWTKWIVHLEYCVCALLIPIRAKINFIVSRPIKLNWRISEKGTLYMCAIV